MQLDLLLSVLCTRFDKEDEDLYLSSYALLLLSDQWTSMIEKLSQLLDAAPIGKLFSQSPLKLHFHIKQSKHHHGPTFTNHKNLLLSTLVSTQEWGSEWLHFVPKRACCCPKRLLATTDSETACVCAGPSYPVSTGISIHPSCAWERPHCRPKSSTRKSSIFDLE